MESKKSDGAAWKKVIKTKNGDIAILNITIGDKRYTAWPNTYKTAGDKSPDYRLFIDTWTPDPSKRSTSAVSDTNDGAGDLDNLPF